MQIIKWLKNEFILEAKVGWNNIKISAITAPVQIIATTVFYFLFKNGLVDGFWFIAGPIIISLITAIIVFIPKRDDPHYQIYYVVHPTSLIKISVLLAIPFFIWLYFYAQCQQYGVNLTSQCVTLILNGKSF